MVPYSDGVRILCDRASFLSGCGRNYTSQFGEDGLIEVALEEFGAVNRWCFEVGAADGILLSNTHRLRGFGWRAVLIEGDEKNFAELEKQKSHTTFCVHEKIGRESLDRILKECGAPVDLDFGSIDIDGQDYWAWKGLEEYRPRLMLVEFDYASEAGPVVIPGEGKIGQASYAAILELGKEKGYAALAKTNCNILFCQSELV